MPNTREKLIELLKEAKAKEQYDFLFGDIDTAIDMPHGAEYYADHLIANGVTIISEHWATEQAYKNGLEDGKPKWIPVSERLPKGAKQGETSENVIAYTIDGEVTTGWLDALGSDKWWIVVGTDDTHTCWGLGYVTHWMPLPEPPTGDNL
jgi:hypothetical protein